MLDVEFVRPPEGLDDAAAGKEAAALIWEDDPAVRGIADPRTPAFAQAVIDTGVQTVAEASLRFLESSECRCEIWADKRVPEPRVFGLKTIKDIAGYVDGWLSRANVSLSIGHSSVHHPLIYIWGALREAGNTKPRDEVGIKLDRDIIGRVAGLHLVALLFDTTQAPIVGKSVGEFLNALQKQALQ